MSDVLTKTQPSQNGVVRITKRGVVKFAFGETGKEFEVDVVQVYDEFVEMEWGFCDENNKIPKEKHPEYRKARVDFTQAIVNDAYGNETAPIITRGESDEFISRILEEVAKLRPFSKESSEEKQSSPSSTEIRFSQ